MKKKPKQKPISKTETKTLVLTLGSLFNPRFFLNEVMYLWHFLTPWLRTFCKNSAAKTTTLRESPLKAILLTETHDKMFT